MTTVSMSTKVGVSAAQLWDIIGGFHSISDWHPAIEKCVIEDQGKVTLRRLSLAGGGEIVERLENPTMTGGARSEEHTSELQSRRNLVCRLLLEKKNKNETIPTCTLSPQPLYHEAL